MGERGPQSDRGNIRILDPVKKQRPAPLQGMSKNAKNIWLRIVNAYPEDHFKPQQYGLLRAYCEAEWLNKKAVLELQKTGEVITQENGVTKESPWVGIELKAFAAMLSCSTKLGISVNATIAGRGKPGEVQRPKSKREGLIFSG